MGLADIKARLAHIAGIENLTVERAQGKEIYHLGEQTIEVPANNAGIRSRVQFLADGLRGAAPEALAKVDQAVAAISDPTPQIEVHKEITGRKMSSMIERLKAKALAARNIAPDAMKAFEADLDGLSAEKAELDAKRAAALAPHQEAIAAVKGELDGLKSAIDILSNDPPA